MSQDLDHQAKIHNILQNLRGIEPLRELFWTELNYDVKTTDFPAGIGPTRLETPSPRSQFSLRRAE